MIPIYLDHVWVGVGRELGGLCYILAVLVFRLKLFNRYVEHIHHSGPYFSDI